MLTPQQNLEEAGRLLDHASARIAKMREPATADVINLANARVTLALALNMVPLVGEFCDDYTDLRGPGKIA